MMIHKIRIKCHTNLFVFLFFLSFFLSIKTHLAWGQVCHLRVQSLSEIERQAEIMNSIFDEMLAERSPFPKLREKSEFEMLLKNIIWANAQNRGIELTPEEIEELRTGKLHTLLTSGFLERKLFQKGMERILVLHRLASYMSKRADISREEFLRIVAQFIVNNQVFGDGNHRSGSFAYLNSIEDGEDHHPIILREFGPIKEQLNHGLRGAMDFTVYNERFNARSDDAAVEHWRDVIRRAYATR